MLKKKKKKHQIKGVQGPIPGLFTFSSLFHGASSMYTLALSTWLKEVRKWWQMSRENCSIVLTLTNTTPKPLEASSINKTPNNFQFWVTETLKCYPFDFGQGVDGVLDGVGRNDVRVISGQVVLARVERELHIRPQLDDGMAAALSPDEQHLHHVLAVPRSHKLHNLHRRSRESTRLNTM